MKGGQGPIFHLAFAGRAWYDRPVKPASRKKEREAPAMTKAEARAKARALWRQWDAAALRTMGGRMAHELFARPEWRQAGTVFWPLPPLPGEPDPARRCWQRALARRQAPGFVPRVTRRRRAWSAVRHAPLLATCCSRGAYGIPRTARGRSSAGGGSARRRTPCALVPCLAAGAGTACAWAAAAGIMTAFWRNIKAEACWCARPR